MASSINHSVCSILVQVFIMSIANVYSVVLNLYS
jgi:hypothetical protein